MLKINPDPTFSADVKITVPGQEETAIIGLKFKYRSKKDAKEFFGALDGRTDAEIFLDMVVGWSGIDAEFSPENAEKFLDNYPAAAMEVFAEYPKLLLSSRVKN